MIPVRCKCQIGPTPFWPILCSWIQYRSMYYVLNLAVDHLQTYVHNMTLLYLYSADTKYDKISYNINKIGFGTPWSLGKCHNTVQVSHCVVFQIYHFLKNNLKLIDPRQCYNFFRNVMEGISHFCGATDTPVLDFR